MSQDRGRYQERYDFAPTGNTSAGPTLLPDATGFKDVYGGAYVWDTAGTFTTALLQVLKSDGVTWATLATHNSASITTVVIGNRARVRVSVTGASGFFSTLT